MLQLDRGWAGRALAELAMHYLPPSTETTNGPAMPWLGTCRTRRLVGCQNTSAIAIVVAVGTLLPLAADDQTPRSSEKWIDHFVARVEGQNHRIDQLVDSSLTASADPAVTAPPTAKTVRCAAFLEGDVGT